MKAALNFKITAKKNELEILRSRFSSAALRARVALKFNELKGELGEEALAAVAAEILRLESLTYHDFAISSWSDDVVKRFVKSAEWILQIAGE